jgi:hypothetical protein
MIMHRNLASSGNVTHQSFRPEQAERLFFNFAPAKLSACAVEKSLFDPSRSLVLPSGKTRRLALFRAMPAGPGFTSPLPHLRAIPSLVSYRLRAFKIAGISSSYRFILSSSTFAP